MADGVEQSVQGAFFVIWIILTGIKRQSGREQKKQNTLQQNPARKWERKLTKYVVKRVLMAILTVFIISMITFFAMNAIPGGPFNKEKASSPAVIAALEARYNLDKPVPVQYVLYMKKLLSGDLGVSLMNGREIKANYRRELPDFCKAWTSGICCCHYPWHCSWFYGSPDEK